MIIPYSDLPIGLGRRPVASNRHPLVPCPILTTTATARAARTTPTATTPQSRNEPGWPRHTVWEDKSRSLPAKVAQGQVRNRVNILDSLEAMGCEDGPKSRRDHETPHLSPKAQASGSAWPARFRARSRRRLAPQRIAAHGPDDDRPLIVDFANADTATLGVRSCAAKGIRGRRRDRTESSPIQQGALGPSRLISELQLHPLLIVRLA